MATFKVKNESKKPIHLEFIQNGMVQHTRWDVASGASAECFVAPGPWTVSAFLACDATKTDQSKANNPDAIVKLNNKLYYIVGFIDPAAANQIPNIRLQKSRAAAGQDAFLLGWNRFHYVVGGYELPKDENDPIIFDNNLDAALFQRVTLAASKEVYDGTSLGPISGGEEQQIVVTGGEYVIHCEPKLLYTISVQVPLKIIARPAFVLGAAVA
jgi:hypothetical protein